MCAVLGELDEQNEESWVKHHPANPDVTTNIRLQALLGPKSEHLWNVMESATYVWPTKYLTFRALTMHAATMLSKRWQATM